jgi:hypothetical protein
MISAPLKPSGGRPTKPGKAGKRNKRSKGSKRGKIANAYTSGSSAEDATAFNRLVQDPEYCWRSGTKCTTDAEDFACCTTCSGGFCE